MSKLVRWRAAAAVAHMWVLAGLAITACPGSRGSALGPDAIDAGGTPPMDGPLQGSRVIDAGMSSGGGSNGGGGGGASTAGTGVLDASAGPSVDGGTRDGGVGIEPPREEAPQLSFERVELTAELGSAGGGPGRGGVLYYDWDRDGKLDLLGFPKQGAFAQHNAIAYKRGLGDGKFAPVQTIVTLAALGIDAKQITSFAPIDIHHDGDPDLVAVVKKDNEFPRFVKLVRENGAFTADVDDPVSQYTLSFMIAGVDPWSMADGSVVDSFSLFRSDQSFKNLTTFLVGSPEEPTELVPVGGAEAEITTQWYTHRVSLDRGDSGGAESTSFVAGDRLYGNLDYDEPGGWDAVTGRFAWSATGPHFKLVSCSYTLRIFLQDKRGVGGRDLPLDEYAPPLPKWERLGQQCTSVTAADLDGDELDDLIVVDSKGSIWALFALGDFQFAEPQRIGSVPELANLGADLRALDVDGDGDSDVMTTQPDDSGVTRIFLNRGSK